MLSKTKIKQRKNKKTNSSLAKLITLAEKKGHLEIAGLLARPNRIQIKANLSKIAELGSEIIVPGKVLGSGNLHKKVKIIALSISQEAKAKLEKAGGEYISLHNALEDLKKGEKLKGELVK